MSDYYQILVVDVPAAQAEACERRLLAHLQERDIIGRTEYRQTDHWIEYLQRQLERWLRARGLDGQELRDQLAGASARQQARRWWSASQGARRIVDPPVARLTIGSEDYAFGVECVRSRALFPFDLPPTFSGDLAFLFGNFDRLTDLFVAEFAEVARHPVHRTDERV